MSISAMSWAWEQPIDPTTKFVLLALSDHANDVDFTCWPSLTHLEKKTGFSRPTIWKAIDRLVELGVMKRVGLHGSGATLYCLSVGNQITRQVTTLPIGNHGNKLGNDVTGVGNHGNKLGNDVTPNHKNHHEPSRTITDDVMIELVLPTGLSEGTWNAFKEARKAARAKMTDHAEKLLLAKLARMAADGQSPEDVVNQSIERGWKGLFPVDGGKQKQGQPKGKIQRAMESCDKAFGPLTNQKALP